MAKTVPEMVERVARAICEAEGYRWSGPISDNPHYEKQARAAIAALREPTDAMGKAMKVALHAPENRHGLVLHECWSAAIDAALSD